MATSGTTEYCNFFFPFVHTLSMSYRLYVVKYLIINILLRVLTKAITCDILLIVTVFKLSEGVLKWIHGKKEDWQ